MSSLGVHIAIGEATARRLLDAAGDDDVMAIVEDVEESLEDVAHCDDDKAWDAIHRALTDGHLDFDNGEYPLNAVILGGRQLYEGDDYIVSLLTPDEVRDVAGALGSVTRERLRAGYDAIDPDDYPSYGSADFEHTWDNFGDLTVFFRDAAEHDRYVIFTVDRV